MSRGVGRALALTAWLAAAAASAAGAKHAARALDGFATVPSAAAAASPVEVFTRANKAYEAGRFADAAALYESLAAAGWADAGLAYNLGNARFRLGDPGRAVLWYERARRLAPRDADILFNLRFARGGSSDEGGLWETLDRLLAPRELLGLVVILVWVIAGLAGLAWWLDWAWSRLTGWLIAAALALAVTGGWLVARGQDLSAPWAIVVEPTLEVRSGPGDQYPVGFTVPAGRRALLLNHRPGWIEIGVPAQSLKGWAPEGTVEPI